MERTVSQDVKDTFKMMLKGRMLYVMPLFIYSAFTAAIYAGVFVNLMTRSMDDPELINNQQLQNITALRALSLLGVGEILGGNIIGPARDWLGNRAAYVI